MKETQIKCSDILKRNIKAFAAIKGMKINDYIILAIENQIENDRVEKRL